MTTTDLATVAQQEWGGGTTPQRAQEGIQTLPRSVFAAIERGNDVESLDLFPDEAWADVPNLPKEVQDIMVTEAQPFNVLAAVSRESEFGPMWRLIITMNDQVFSIALGGGQRWRDAKLQRVADVLELGARSVGPFILIEVDTGKGNPFRDIRSVPKNHTGTVAKPGANKK